MRPIATAAAALLAATASAHAQLDLRFTGRYTPATPAEGGAEIPAFDPLSRRAFVVNGAANSLDVLDLSNPAAPSLVSSLAFGAGGSANSVAVRNGVVAVAVEAPMVGVAGEVRFLRAADLTPLGTAPAGFLPDQLTFSPDGTKVLVANEGEPSGYNQPGSVDPVGSVSVIPVTIPSAGNVTIGAAANVGFESFNPQVAALRAQGVRIFGPNATVAQDLEPEYVSVSPDSTRAYVALQENNALATIDLATNTVTAIRALGLKDHSQPANALDPSDRDGPGGTASINIRPEPVFGMYQPDAIATFSVGGQAFHVTANEGDAREYDGFEEEVRVGSSSYVLDPTALPNAAELKAAARLGRLQVSNATGDTDGDGDFDQIHAFGARSFSIRREDGSLAYDSGDDLERITAERVPELFNSEGEVGDVDDRSDSKGPEPEGVVVGEAFGRTLAFVGLERVGGVMVFDLADPTAPAFVDYLNTGPADLGPEGLTFVSAADSPTGVPLLIVANEVSATLSVYSLVVPEPTTLAAAAMAGAVMLRRRRR